MQLHADSALTCACKLTQELLHSQMPSLVKEMDLFILDIFLALVVSILYFNVLLAQVATVAIMRMLA